MNLSHNGFGNEIVDKLTNSLSRNMTLNYLNLSGNEFFARFNTQIREDPSILIIGKESSVYKMLAAAATSQALRKFHVFKLQIFFFHNLIPFFVLAWKKSSRCTMCYDYA